MKKYFLWLLCFLFFGCTQVAEKSKLENLSLSKNISEKKMNSKNFSAIEKKTFQNFLESGDFIVIDIRTPVEIASGKITNDALEIDFYEPDFIQKISALEKNKKYLIYCHAAHRSASAIKLMKEIGFSEAYDLEGGIINWVNT